MRSILGLDIGGANLKAAHTDGSAHNVPFALWKAPQDLPKSLADLVKTCPDFDELAVTMTGELCDCFANKQEGVHAILDAVEQAVSDKSIRVWQTSGQFVDVPAARQNILGTAAANWHALATYAGRFTPDGAAVLLDIGSTTTDIIPLINGKPASKGLTDTDRLKHHELVYTGVKRTPVCALLGNKVMSELFATTWDVYLILSDTADSEDCDTADGRPADRAHAHARMARMTGADVAMCEPGETEALARQASAVQISAIRHALRKVLHTLPTPPKKWILSGSGEFLVKRILQAERIPEDQWLSLTSQHGGKISSAACAHALVVLAGEQCSG